MRKINLTDKFNLFNEYWAPRIVGELNGQFLKLAKFKGEFIWHSHHHEDELFLVVKGEIIIQLRQYSIKLNEGEFFIVPKGIEHKPIAIEEAYVILLEPKSTQQTGGIDSNLLINQLWI